MAEELYIPKLGQTVEEVTIIHWLVEDGARVKQGQEVVEVQTDKAVFQVEATAGGYLHIGPYKEGQVVPVLTVVAVIGAPDEVFKPGKVSLDQAAADIAQKSAETSAAAPKTSESPLRTPVSNIFASPRARRLAKQSRVDLLELTPSGGNGVRIIERDVLAYLERRAALGRAGGETRVPVPAERGIVAGRLTTSAHAVAHVTLTMVVDFTALAEIKNRSTPPASELGSDAPGYTDYLLKVTAMALRRFPNINARLQGNRIERLAEINVGLVVDTGEGQLSPVIRECDRKTLRQIGIERHALVERARQGTYLSEDLTGGTFTLCNLGMYDVEAFTPIITPQEAAVLGVGLIAPRQIARGEALVVRQTCTLSLSVDNRLVDGAPAARFLQFIKRLIEQPALWLAYTS